MDTDWFLKVIEGSSVNADLCLSFGDSSWNSSLAEEPETSENGNLGSEGDNKEDTGVDTETDDGESEEFSFASVDDSSAASDGSKATGTSFSQKFPQDDSDSESVTAATDSEIEEVATGEWSSTGKTIYNAQCSSTEEGQDFSVEECSLIHGNCQAEHSEASTGLEDNVSEAYNDYETYGGERAEGQSENEQQEQGKYLCMGPGHDSESENVEGSEEDGLEEFVDDAAGGASDEDEEDPDDSLLDFAGELGVSGSDSSDSELECAAEESFASAFSPDPSVSEAGSKILGCTEFTDSQLSTSSRKPTSSLVCQPHAESIHSSRATSNVHSKQSFIISSASSPAVSMTLTSKSSRTSPTQFMELDLSEAEKSWLPPLAFTEEDSHKPAKPENKAVGGLLREFAQLRRRVSDEYEIAEKVRVRRKSASISSSCLAQPPDYEKAQKMIRKRAKVITEILETEKTYQHHLDMIVKVTFSC